MKNTKTLAVSLALLLLTVCMVIGFSACKQTSCQHQWKDATCTSPKLCSLCLETEGNPLSHTGGTATCSKKAVCSYCNTEYGEFASHAFTENDVKAEALKSAANCSAAAVYYKSCACGSVSTNNADTFTNGRIGKHQYGQTTVCTICGFDAGDLYYYNFAESFATTEGASLVIKDFVFETETNYSQPTGIKEIISFNIGELELFVEDGKLGGNGHGKIRVTYFGSVTKYYEATATISDGYVYVSLKDEGSQSGMLKYSVEELVYQCIEARFYGNTEQVREMLSFIDETVFPVIGILAKNSKSDLNKFLNNTLNAVFTFEKQADGSVIAKPNKDKILALNNNLAEKKVAEVIDFYYGEGIFDSLVEFTYEILDMKLSEIPEFVEENDIDYDEFIAALQEFTHKIGNPAEGEEGYIDLDAEIKNSEYSDSILADLVLPSIPEDCASYKEAIDEYVLSVLREKSLYEIYGYDEDYKNDINDGIEELFNYVDISIFTNAAGEFTNINLNVNKMPYYDHTNSNGIFHKEYVSFSIELTANGTINKNFDNLVEEFNKEAAPIPESEKEKFEYNTYSHNWGTSIDFKEQSYHFQVYYDVDVIKADFSSIIGEHLQKNCGSWNQYMVLLNAESYRCYVYFVENDSNMFFLKSSRGTIVQLTKTTTGFSVLYEDDTTKELVVAIDGTPTAEDIATLVPEIFETGDYYCYDTVKYIDYYYNTQTKEYGTEDQHNWNYSYEKFGDVCGDGYKSTQICSNCNIEVVNYYDYHDTEETRVEFADHGMCGGYIKIYKCRVCDYAYINQSNSCYWLCLSTDDNGFTVYQCSRCGAIKKTKNVTSEKDENCQYTREYFYIYSINDQEIFNDKEVDTSTSHSYEYTYELKGETCADGYIETETCKDCGYTRTYDYTAGGHNNTSWRYVYLNELGMCGGYIEEYYCGVCSTVINISYVYDSACSWELLFDNVDGYAIYECSQCNAIKKYKYFATEKDANCSYNETIEYIYIVNGTEVYKGTDNNSYYSSHNYEYSYELFGATCDEGYRITEICKDCGYTDSWTSSSHRTQYTEVSLGDLGMCGGYIEEGRCQVCDTITNIYINNYCTWNLQYDDADGFSVYKCSDCNAIRKYKSNSGEKDEDCSYAYTEEYIYIVGGKTVYSGSETSYNSDHNYEYTYELLGATCEDGYNFNYTCTDCGYSDWSTYYGHDGSWFSLSLGDLGLCGGYAAEYHCEICNTISDFYISYSYCDLEFIYDDPDGYSISKCTDCGIIWKEKSNDSEYSLIIQKDGKEIYRVSYIC